MRRVEHPSAQDDFPDLPIFLSFLPDEAMRHKGAKAKRERKLQVARMFLRLMRKLLCRRSEAQLQRSGLLIPKVQKPEKPRTLHAAHPPKPSVWRFSVRWEAGQAAIAEQRLMLWTWQWLATLLKAFKRLRVVCRIQGAYGLGSFGFGSSVCLLPCSAVFVRLGLRHAWTEVRPNPPRTWILLSGKSCAD